jgi:hypothetical protein
MERGSALEKKIVEDAIWTAKQAFDFVETPEKLSVDTRRTRGTAYKNLGDHTARTSQHGSVDP